MGFFGNIFGKKESNLPCKKTGECPYEHEKNPERDIEGMPFVANDPRSCPEYDHICPEFMEDFSLTPEELEIRAIIHQGAMIRNFKSGSLDFIGDENEALIDKYDEISGKYPKKDYPQYY